MKANQLKMLGFLNLLTTNSSLKLEIFDSKARLFSIAMPRSELQKRSLHS
jgi:hypothetical protein